VRSCDGMNCVCSSIDKKSPSSLFTTQPNISTFDNADGQLATNKPQPPLSNPVVNTLIQNLEFYC